MCKEDKTFDKGLPRIVGMGIPGTSTGTLQQLKSSVASSFVAALHLEDRQTRTTMKRLCGVMFV